VLEVSMRRSGSCSMSAARPGPRGAAALALAAIAVAGCQVTAAASGRSATAPASGRSTVAPTAGHSAASAPAHPTQSPEASKPARIMIVGDSITEGSSGDYTWQFRLYEHLRADGARPQMVGPYHWLFNNVTKHEGSQSYANPRFERANDATWGMTLFREKEAIGAKVARYRPDYLLVLLGLDDIYWYGIGEPQMTANLAGFIAAARNARPRIRIVLGLIPPDIHQQTSAALAASIASYNNMMSATASQLSTTRSPIAVAQDGAGINVAADLWDGTHLNANGEIKIAAAFADVLASRFRLGDAYPTPFPVLPTGPLTRPRLTITPSRTAGEAKLSWTLVPGADGYRVFQQDATQGQATFKELPFPLTPAQRPWTAGLLNPGETYYFKIQACKGADCGAFSNVVSVTAP
ncbi:MAG: GDSL-type esterase/lipase family protein, partial [Streptosporangiaceae bacterium]